MALITTRAKAKARKVLLVLFKLHKTVNMITKQDVLGTLASKKKKDHLVMFGFAYYLTVRRLLVQFFMLRFVRYFAKVQKLCV